MYGFQRNKNHQYGRKESGITDDVQTFDVDGNRSMVIKISILNYGERF